MRRRTSPVARLGCAAAVALALASFPSLAHAHVGSPDTWFEGLAGPYPVRVVVRAPGAIPGLAEIDVRVLEGRASQVTAQARAWNANADLAPPADVAKTVSGDPSLYSVPMWFMAATTYAVTVQVSGDRGAGTAVLPVQMTSTRRLPMEPPLVWTLVALGLFLCVGLLTFVGAAVRESEVPPGEAPDARRRSRARVVIVVTAAILMFGLAGGRRWWNGLDHAFREELYRPFHAVATLLPGASGGMQVQLAIDDPRWLGRSWTPLIPDHGKIMHLFLVQEPDLNAIAHLHPLLRDSSHFVAVLPSVPPGHYRVYGDIVHESGFAQTVTASVVVPPPSAGAAAPPSDPDDSWYSGGSSPVVGPAAEPFALPDGSFVTWERGAAPIVAGEEYPLRFVVRARSGEPAILEPYMGMAAHAVITRDDGSVFAHLHPIGSISMASEMVVTTRTDADSVPGTLGRRITAMGEHPMMPVVTGPPGEFTIPYGFPRAGRYRIWVQVRLHGQVMTAAFDADVAPAPSRKATA